MIFFVRCFIAVILGLPAISTISAQAANETTTIRVGWCIPGYNASITPIAVANQMGWFAEKGIKVEVLPISGSNDCVRLIGTGDIHFALPSVEPVALFHARGLRSKIFYTAYQGNIYSLAAPESSSIKDVADLKGKRIGVNSMASAAAVLARAAIANAHLDPNKDVSFVVVGLGAQSLTLLNNQQVDALSQFDMQYAFLANSGIPMRTLPTPEMEKFPGNGFIALEDTLKSRRKEAVALARGYAMGTIYSIANPAAAIKLLWREYPQTKPAGKEPAKALSDEVNILNARIVNWKLERGGVTRWGESSIQNYQAYLDFLLKHNVMKEKVSAADIIDNTLLTEINDFDINKLIEQAKQAKE